jgi:predicted small integral membrane protein
MGIILAIPTLSMFSWMTEDWHAKYFGASIFVTIFFPGIFAIHAKERKGLKKVNPNTGRLLRYIFYLLLGNVFLWTAMVGLNSDLIPIVLASVILLASVMNLFDNLFGFKRSFLRRKWTFSTYDM